MKKCFLASSFGDVAYLLADVVGNGLNNKRITFIPTAALHEEVNFFVEAGKNSLEQLGMIVEELELSTASPQEVKSKLEQNDYIYVTGGNTFFLLQELRKTGADQILAEQIQSGKVYIGESAGSVILSPNIEYLKTMDDWRAAPQLESFAGLGIVDFYPLPHDHSYPFEEIVEKIILEYDSVLNLKPITNLQALWIEGDDCRILESLKK